MIRAAAIVLLLSLTTLARAEDVIELDTGRVLKGHIIRAEKAWVGIDTGDGVVWLERGEIKSVTRGEPSPRRSEPVPAAKQVNGEGDGTGGTERPAAERRPPVTTEQPPEKAGTGAAADKGTPTEEELVLTSITSQDPAQRGKASAWIVETWPRWRSAVERTLRESRSQATRLTAIRTLDGSGVEDVLDLVKIGLADESPQVRAATLRIVRHRKLTELEARVLDMMRSDATWAVRQEAIRTLEDIGGAICLPHVMAAWESETDKDRRRRYRRVMAALLGDDFGDDANAWFIAANELFMGRRVIRHGKVADPDDS